MKMKEVDAYAMTMHNSMQAFAYHALALDVRALVKSLKFELKVKRPSRCNAHRSEFVCT